MRVGSLFAGIGGFDLAARWIGWKTEWVSEIDPYASAVLKKHWPDAPNLGDITKITNPPPVDILVGGFPCQDISLAGKGEGIGGARSGLWKHYARIIGEIRPRWVVAENVSALRSRGLDVVLKDLMALGYDAEWHCIPAAYVGAPHRRDRIWIVAHPNSHGGRFQVGSQLHSESLEGSPHGDSCRRHVDGFRNEVANSICAGLEGHAGNSCTVRRQAACGSATESCVRSREDAARWWEVEPDVGRVAHGVSRRVDRLKCLGNAIVPQVAYEIFKAIQQNAEGC